jgi:phytoene dehydrogenase-like protein
MTVCETIFFWSLPAGLDREQWDLPGLFFWSKAGADSYDLPRELIDLDMVILCAPLQFDRSLRQQACYPSSEGGELFTVRLTTRASAAWIDLFEQDPASYREKKEQLASALRQWLCHQFPIFDSCQLLGQDVFTPKTIKHYCRHPQGELYGGSEKIYGGLLDPAALPQFYIIGADQGPAGLIGAMMSGAVMASHPHLSNLSKI